MIEVQRSVAYGPGDVFTKPLNSIYQQISKALLLCYAANLPALHLSHISVTRNTVRKEPHSETVQYDRTAQILPGDIVSPVQLDERILRGLLQEDTKAMVLRSILSHWLKGMSSADRNYKFDRLWRAFEQLAHYHHGHGEMLQPNVKKALCKMRNFMTANPHLFVHTRAYVSTISSDELRDFHWINLIFDKKYEKDSPAPLENFKNYLILNNTDYRLFEALDRTIRHMRNKRNESKILDGIQKSVEERLMQHKTDDMQLAAVLCCKYAAFLRNKTFHGEIMDNTFSLIPNNQDDALKDKLNALLGILIAELINAFDLL